ncbi:MAG: AAA family ATPase, partial [Cyanobacteria bacterium P01_C01_bin.72]
MRLNHLQLCNFRQFYGRTPQIRFASGKRPLDCVLDVGAGDHGEHLRNRMFCNTTVIYGNNGAGKTSILNAFTWVLYEKFTAAFASPELLVNQRALAEASPEQAVECWVELQFERDRQIYQLKRKCYATRNAQHQVSYSQANLFMLVAGDDGRWYPPLEAPEEIINRILPASLHQYFFFDGERIDGFFRQNQGSRIAEDTKELLGVKILDRGIEHLKKAKRSLQEELSQLGDARTKQLLRTQIDLEQELAEISQLTTKLGQDVAELERRKSNLSRQLLAISGADEIQQLKLRLLKQHKSLKQDLVQHKKELKKLLSRHGYLVFLPALSDRLVDLMQTLRD